MKQHWGIAHTPSKAKVGSNFNFKVQKPLPWRSSRLRSIDEGSNTVGGRCRSDEIVGSETRLESTQRPRGTKDVVILWLKIYFHSRCMKKTMFRLMSTVIESGVESGRICNFIK